MSDDGILLRSTLSVMNNEDEIDDDDLDNDDGDRNNTTTPLRKRILDIVKESKDYTIRPTTLSQKLGLSVNDASAELCGLLQVVGEGSSFYFEDVDGSNVKTMVFQFPPDYERKALQAQRKEDWHATFRKYGRVVIKTIKVFIAFGLILSVIIVSIAGFAALIAAFVALSRGGGGESRGARNHITRQMHNLIITLRQLLWCYVMFGPMGDGEQDPFFREAAYDTWLVMSLCCGNPGSIFFWWRAHHLRQRRHRLSRGWGGRINSHVVEDTASDLEGVTLIRRNLWTGQDEQIPVPTVSSIEQHRGLLSSMVEFLFGPTTPVGPSEADKWRLRSAIILEKATKRENSEISLQELAPFTDSPPSSLNDSNKMFTQGLVIVAHFNGVPSPRAESQVPRTRAGSNDPSKSQFVFPELIAEGSAGVHYNDLVNWDLFYPKIERNQWDGLFYANDSESTMRRTNRSTLPHYLYEPSLQFTTLTQKQFYHCLLIDLLNFVGVIWFSQSLDSGGILEQTLGRLGVALKTWLIPVLWFYARLFLVIPVSRLCYIFLWNGFCERRNTKRELLANALDKAAMIAMARPSLNNAPKPDYA